MGLPASGSHGAGKGGNRAYHIHSGTRHLEMDVRSLPIRAKAIVADLSGATNHSHF